MKILVLLSASLFGFGLAMQNTANEISAPVANAATIAPVIEQPVMEVLLDTVEITASAPKTFAAVPTAEEGVLLDTVEVVVTAPAAIAANLD